MRPVPALVLLLAACSTERAPAPAPVPADPTPADTQQAPATDPTMAPATPAPAADGPWKPSGEAVGHCAATEHAVLNCPVKGGKILSVCGGPGADQLQYRFGAAGKPELVFPPTPSLEPWKVEQRTYVRAMGTVASFENEGVTYEVTSMIGGGGGGEAEAERNNFVGVAVLKDGEELTRLGCTNLDGDGLEMLLDVPGLGQEPG